MPLKRARGCKTGDGDALAECVLPEDLMLCILTRLPVKTINRFKSVCKPWLKSFSTPKFIKMHRAQFSQNPENESVVIHSVNAEFEYTMALFQINSMKKPTDLGLPIPLHYRGAHFVGCSNGLLCLAFLSFEEIFLWNPALNSMFISIPVPEMEAGLPRMPTASLGFGYDEEADDFKVIRIVLLEKVGIKNIGVGVYSVNSGSWTIIDVGIKCNLLGYNDQTIVNGIMYWAVNVDDKWVMLCFDVGKAECKGVHNMPSPSCKGDEEVHVLMVDWKEDVVAALMFKKNGERVLSLDVWVFDDVGKTWSKDLTFGPIELNVDTFLGFWKNRVFFEADGGKLFAFDTENGGGVEEIVVDGAQNGYFNIHGYTESLMYMKGMSNQMV